MERANIWTDRQTDRKNSSINRLLFRNRAVLRDCPYIVLSKHNCVNLNAWFTHQSTHANVGDYLSLVVLNHVCERKGIDRNKVISKTKHLYAIGSILPGYQDATVWGSGFGYSKPRKWYSAFYNWFHRHYHCLDIRAVRGPETQRLLSEMGIPCPEIYGDPAVLMPLFYAGRSERESQEYVIIPHYSKLGNYKNIDHVLGTFTADYERFLDKLLEARLVISSSLHGIILAEAYGIPAIMLNDTPTEDITKYKDWYYSTGRYDFPIADTVEEALMMEPALLDKDILKAMQERLLDSFPTDLWD